MIVHKELQHGVLRMRFDRGDSLDYACAADVKADALSAIDGTADLVVDLSNLEFIDSTGVGVLVSLLKTARLNRRAVRFTGVRPGVLSVLRSIKLDRIFEVQSEA